MYADMYAQSSLSVLAPAYKSLGCDLALLPG